MSMLNEVVEMAHQLAIGRSGKVDGAPESVSSPAIFVAGIDDSLGTGKKFLEPPMKLEKDVFSILSSRIDAFEKVLVELLLVTFQQRHGGTNITNSFANFLQHWADDVFRDARVRRCSHDGPGLVGELLEANELMTGKEADLLLYRMPFECHPDRQVRCADEQRHDNGGTDIVSANGAYIIFYRGT